MPSDTYDYSLVENGYTAYPRKSFRFWRALCVSILIIDAIFLIVFFVKGEKEHLTALDTFQKLNNISVIDTEFSHSLLAPTNFTSNPDERAVVSSLYTDSYIDAIITLGQSLKAVNTSARMILIYIPGRLSTRTLCMATAAGWTMHPVALLSPPKKDGGQLWEHYKDQYTKLRIWTLDTIGIKSAVYLDADTIVRKNFDELFTLPFNFGAVPDVFFKYPGYHIGFNAGVLLFRPNSAVYEDMISKLQVAKYITEAAEQGFLNVYFASQVVRLPYAYNANLAIKARTPKLWEGMKDDMRIVHYTLDKPFPAYGVGVPQHLEEFIDGQMKLRDGMWKNEMTWWLEFWREAMRLQKSVARC